MHGTTPGYESAARVGRLERDVKRDLHEAEMRLSRRVAELELTLIRLEGKVDAQRRELESSQRSVSETLWFVAMIAVTLMIPVIGLLKR